MKELSTNHKFVSIVWCVIVVCLRLCYTAEGIVKMPGNETVPALILFGDSIVDTSTNNYLATLSKCNFLPYGRNFPGGMPTGRFSNGKVPADFIAEELGIKAFVPPYNDPSLQLGDLLTGDNFASGGSGYDPLTPKMQQFKEYIGKLKGNFGEERTNFMLSKSIVLVVASSNDIANTYFASGVRKVQYDIPSYTDLLARYASSFIKEIYGLGARKIGVFGAPPLGCLPFMRTLFEGIGRDCSEEINLASKLFNAKLSAGVDNLNQNLPQAKVVYIDVYKSLLDIIENPTKYGFEVVDKGCCGTGNFEVSILCNQLEPETCTQDSKYVFWDSYHPTERTYQILVGKALNGYIGGFF